MCLPQFLSSQKAKNALNVAYGNTCYTAETKTTQLTDLWSVRLGHIGISESFHIRVNFKTTLTKFLQLKFRKILWKISAPFDSTPGISIESWLNAKKVKDNNVDQQVGIFWASFPPPPSHFPLELGPQQVLPNFREKISGKFALQLVPLMEFTGILVEWKVPKP